MLGFNSFSTPSRTTAPSSSAVATPFADFGGSALTWESDLKRRYEQEALRAAQPPSREDVYVELVPQSDVTQGWYENPLRAPHYEELLKTVTRDMFNSYNTGASPFGSALTDQGYSEVGDYLWDKVVPYLDTTKTFAPHLAAQDANGISEFNPTALNAFDSHVKSALNAYLPGTSGGSHLVKSQVWSTYKPDFASLDAEKARLSPLAEQQMRQQQAYDWMQGGQQQNAIMSGDYANAGFNTITGMSNPYAGPDAASLTGIDTDWLQGVYDPNTQRGTGTYNPTNYSKNTGW